jgi:hypothetical protein
LLSARPRQQIAELFNQVTNATRNLDLLQTSKHFPKEQWPCLWSAEASQVSNKTANEG